MLFLRMLPQILLPSEALLADVTAVGTLASVRKQMALKGLFGSVVLATEGAL